MLCALIVILLWVVSAVIVRVVFNVLNNANMARDIDDVECAFMCILGPITIVVVLMVLTIKKIYQSFSFVVDGFLYPLVQKLVDKFVK